MSFYHPVSFETRSLWRWHVTCSCLQFNCQLSWLMVYYNIHLSGGKISSASRNWFVQCLCC